jgi:hypothetical protein
MTPTADRPPSPGYEKNTVSVRGVMYFVVVLVAAAIVVQLAMWGIFRLYFHEAGSEDRPLPPMVAGSLARLPPLPRLEVRPLDLRAKLNAQELARLNGYGWVDKSAGIVHIPISRAMDLIATTGIPETKGAVAAAAPPAPTAGASR